MKKTYILILLSLLGIGLQAQNSRVISGMVMNKNYQMVVPNYPVTVIDSSSNGGVAVYSYQTNANGMFTDTITTQGESGQLWFTAPDSCGITKVVLGYSTNTPVVMATAGLVLCNKIIQTNISVGEIEKYSLVVYPNPTTDELFINLKGKYPIGFFLLDGVGRQYNPNISSNGDLILLNIGHLPKGVYYLKVKTEYELVVVPIYKN